MTIFVELPFPFVSRCCFLAAPVRDKPLEFEWRLFVVPDPWPGLARDAELENLSRDSAFIDWALLNPDLETDSDFLEPLETVSDLNEPLETDSDLLEPLETDSDLIDPLETDSDLIVPFVADIDEEVAE